MCAKDRGGWTGVILKNQPLKKLLRQNLESGAHAKDIFSLLVLELWHRRFLSNRGGDFMSSPGRLVFVGERLMAAS
jgi:hypothetical protein